MREVRPKWLIREVNDLELAFRANLAVGILAEDEDNAFIALLTHPRARRTDRDADRTVVYKTRQCLGPQTFLRIINKILYEQMTAESRIRCVPLPAVDQLFTTALIGGVDHGSGRLGPGNRGNGRGGYNVYPPA